VVFLEHLTEKIVGEPEVVDGFAMLGKLTQEGMMYVHRLFTLFVFKFDSLPTYMFELRQ
jgi:hypothetical protein